MMKRIKIIGEKLKKIIWPFWSKDAIGKPVYFEDTGEEMGIVRKVLRNSNGNIIGYEIEEKNSGKVMQFPSTSFENTERGLVFIPMWYSEAKEFIEELELKTKMPELQDVLRVGKLSKREVSSIATSNSEIRKYVENASLLRKCLEKRLREIEMERLEVRRHLMSVSEKRLLNEIGRREFAKEVLEGRRKSKILEINMQRCKELLIRFDSIPFLAKPIELEKEEMPMLKSIMDNIPVNVIVTDENKNIVSVNDYFLKNLHYSPEKIKNKRIEEFIPNGNFNDIKLKEGKDIEFAFIDGDGKARKMFGKYLTMENGIENGIGILAFQEKLEEGEEFRKILAKQLSHEFFNPLCIAQGYIYLLEEGKYGELNDQQRKQIDAISKSLSRIEKLVKETIKVKP
ncbi:MAG: PAS domain S-box protein [Thermoplasmata archaeon]|nr:MAG: PAS domain S-box protein [Thermoplasmata archaeon]